MDTTNVKTESRNAIVIQLQRLFAEKKLEESKFIGCQYHVIDRRFRLVMDVELAGNNTSPDIEYRFISSR